MRLFTTLIVLASLLTAQDPAIRVQGYHIDGPRTPADFPQWIADMHRWRTEYLKRIGYSGGEYDRPELTWTQSSYMQPQMMIEDRYFFDPKSGKYTVDRYLDDLDKRYGGIDAVLVWHTYPNIGIDSRNQFDHFRDMPGGISGIKRMVADFHRRGVRVLFPMMLWDQGTRDFGVPESQALAEELAEVGADGINGDTMQAVPREYRTASDKTGHPLAFEPEHLNIDEALAYNNLSWGPAVPPGTAQAGSLAPPLVFKYKWLEPRHMANISDRWQRDKNVDLQFAFFNGVGMETWENIWGIWNEMTSRDSEIVRRIARIERKFSANLNSADWEPHTPVLQAGIYASKWPEGGRTVWTIVSKNEFDVAGPQIEIQVHPGQRYFDLWHGVELKPEVKSNTAVLNFAIEANGYGALLAIDSSMADSSLNTFLAGMKTLAQNRLDSFSTQRNILQQKITSITSTKPADGTPAGMIRIPASDFLFVVSGIEIEGENQIGVDVQYPWENAARRNHESVVPIKSFYIDRYPVTNADFKKFVDASKYRPQDNHNFLKDWKDGSFPEGSANKPVTWVSLEDARAYTAWAGKRLPHEWEWQYAAQGADGRIYPWGNQWDSAAVPAPDKGRNIRMPDDVSAHPSGKSPFGVEDLTGNVWQWTDEYSDDHTRAGILRGGSYYQPQGSKWYFPQAYNLTQHGKLLLMAPSKDRAGTVGFRCAVDSK
ncbi:MAG: formylglycine-generating enzyme family protein [Acidobacteriota bacterium]|nr:formylglycine-generating enzyme family protein [Acidobacteriota bacterium]